MGNNIKRVDWEKLRLDPEYKENFNWGINADNMRIIEDSLIGRNAGYAQRIAILSLIVPENGGSPEPHGNGAFGLVGWRGDRAIGLPPDLTGQTHKLMTELFEPTSGGGTWTDGGKGTGVMTGKDMLKLYLKTDNSLLAAKAVMKGYVRPPKKDHDKRLLFVPLLKKYMR